MKAAYWLKERFFNLWQESNREQAETAYQDWKACIPSRLEGSFQPLLTAMNNWYQPIFAYFDYAVSNAWTEALNGLIKTAQRNARGFSFEVLRAKVLETGGVQRTTRPAYRERKPPQADIVSQDAQDADTHTTSPSIVRSHSTIPTHNG